MEPDRKFIPALGLRALTPLYDPLLRWVMREQVFKRRLIVLADLAGRRTLDVGCGTGTLTVMAKRAHPDADLVGLDPDPDVLRRARARAARQGLAITWDEGFATQLPYPDGSFDRAVSSLVWHHLTRPEKRTAFAEVLRVLRPLGEFHLLDFGPARSTAMRPLAFVLRRLEQAADNFDGLLPGMMVAAGFDPVVEAAHLSTLLGPLVAWRAVRPR